MLSRQLNIKERKIRDEVDILKNLELLKIDFKGMYITEKGKELLIELKPIYANLKDIPILEEKLKNKLGIKKVRIAPGDSNKNHIILKDMGKITFKIFKEILKEKNIIGITGGSTMAKVVEECEYYSNKKDILVIPARGALGSDVENQSNSIAAKLAKKLGGNYKLLYLPDTLDKDTLEHVLKNKEIKESKDIIENINTLIFGIGRADTMASRRNLEKSTIETLDKQMAVAEAFGHYFNIKGEEVWVHKTIGLSLDKFKNLDNLIGVAGGEEKAQAIMAVSTLNANLNLITDEAAAKKILKIF